MASRKQRGSGFFGFGKSKKENASTKKNNKKNAKNNAKNANNGYERAMAMGLNTLRQLQSQVKPNNVRKLKRNVQNTLKQKEEMNKVVAGQATTRSAPVAEPMSNADLNDIERRFKKLQRNLANKKELENMFANLQNDIAKGKA
jgi:hypothetical protein